MTSLLAYSVHLDLPPHRKHHQDPQFHGCALLSSSSPPHRKNDQINHRGAKLTTTQTIASTPPAHVKISSSITKTILSQNQTHFPKNPSHLVQNRLLLPNLVKAKQVQQLQQAKQAKQAKQMYQLCNFSSLMLVLVS